MSTAHRDRGDVVVRKSGARCGLFSGLRPGSVLDVPAGEGEQSEGLVRLGYRVVSIDLFPGTYRGSAQIVQADANARLPFRDASFDYVLSREGIEHLESQLGFLRECRRVLKLGGSIVITTPNLMQLSARMSLFLSGQRNLRRGLVNEEQTLRSRRGGRLYHGHVFLLDYFRLRYMLRIAGFDRLEVYTDRYSPTSVALSPLIPLLRASTWLSLATAARANRNKGRRQLSPAVAGEIRRHVLSRALLFGKRMIVTAVAV